MHAQMIADADRGCFWTRAMLGLPANEVHLCGDGSALSLVAKLCAVTGESFEGCVGVGGVGLVL